MDIKFNNLEELYNRLTPALKTKISDLYSKKIFFINEQDLWNYLQDMIWIKDNNLSLDKMVNDILNIDELELINYYKKNVKDNDDEK